MLDNFKKKPIKPIEFTENWRENPIVFMDKDVNTDTNFAILKTTQNGKFMRGNMLFYSLNGVEIYTDPNNIIYVDTVNNTLFIKEYSKVINEISPEDPEKKQYIILYTDLGYENGDENFPLRWEAVQGRTMAYEAIKANAPVIDIDKSIVIVENVSINDSLSIRQFVNYVQNADMVEKDNFDINDFAGSEYV
jgi:hypothetical protein